MFAGWGSWVARFRWPVLTVALVAVVSAGIWGLGVFGQLTEGGYNDPNSESARAGTIVQQALGSPAADLVAIYTPADGKIDDPALTKRIKARLAALPSSAVKAQASYWQQKSAQYAAKDRSSAVAVITLVGPDDAAKLDQFRQIKDDFAVDGADVRLAGGVSLNDASSTRSTADLGTAELISLPITLVLLLFIFGSLVAAALPVLVGSLAVLGSLGVLHAVAQHNQVNSFAVNVASLLGLGMAIDYGLFMVGRFREEQAHGRTPVEAVRRTVGTAGRTVVFSATLLMIALSGLLLFPQGFLNSLAYGGLSAVALAAFLSLTLLPALLAVLGHRVDKLPIRLPRRAGAGPAGSGWARVAGAVLRRPVVVALPILAILVLLAWPVRGVHFADSDERILPSGDAARVAVEVLKADYPQFTNNGIQIVLQGTQDTGAFLAAARAVPGIDQVGPAVRTARGTFLTATLRSNDPYSAAARDAVDGIRRLPLPPGAQLLVGGTTARNLDSLHATAAKLPLMAALLAGATLVLMFLAFGSILLPIKAVLMSALSLSATFGVLVWIFQDGHLAGLFGVTPAPLEVGIVVLMAAVVFGLSTDYEVFLLSRMVEARTRGASTADAVTTGLARTGRVISAAAVLLIVVTGAFGVSAVSTMRFVGVGMIVALLLDATVVRMLLVPAVLGLLGDAAWWAPGPLRRLQQRAGLAEYDGDELFPAGPVGRHAAPDDTVILTAAPASGTSQLVPELLSREIRQVGWAQPTSEISGFGSARPLVLPGRAADATVVFPAFTDDASALSTTLRIELEEPPSASPLPDEAVETVDGELVEEDAAGPGPDPDATGVIALPGRAAGDPPYADLPYADLPGADPGPLDPGPLDPAGEILDAELVESDAAAEQFLVPEAVTAEAFPDRPLDIEGSTAVSSSDALIAAEAAGGAIDPREVERFPNGPLAVGESTMAAEPVENSTSPAAGDLVESLPSAMIDEPAENSRSAAAAVHVENPPSAGTQEPPADADPEVTREPDARHAPAFHQPPADRSATVTRPAFAEPDSRSEPAGADPADGNDAAASAAPHAADTPAATPETATPEAGALEAATPEAGALEAGAPEACAPGTAAATGPASALDTPDNTRPSATAEFANMPEVPDSARDAATAWPAGKRTVSEFGRPAGTATAAQPADRPDTAPDTRPAEIVAGAGQAQAPELTEHAGSVATVAGAEQTNAPELTEHARSVSAVEPAGWRDAPEHVELDAADAGGVPAGSAHAGDGLAGSTDAAVDEAARAPLANAEAVTDRQPDAVAVENGVPGGPAEAEQSQVAAPPSVDGSGTAPAAVADGDVAYEMTAQASGKLAARPEAEPTAPPADAGAPTESELEPAIPPADAGPRAESELEPAIPPADAGPQAGSELEPAIPPADAGPQAGSELEDAAPETGPEVHAGAGEQAGDGHTEPNRQASDTPLFAGTGSMSYAALFPQLFAEEAEPAPERYSDDWSAPVSEDAFFAPAAPDPVLYRMDQLDSTYRPDRVDEPAVDERYVTRTPADEEHGPAPAPESGDEGASGSEPGRPFEPWIPEPAAGAPVREPVRETPEPAPGTSAPGPVFEMPTREPLFENPAPEPIAESPAPMFGNPAPEPMVGGPVAGYRAAERPMPAPRRPADLSELAAAWRQVIENRPPATERPADLAGYVGQNARRPAPEPRQARGDRPTDLASYSPARRPAEPDPATDRWRTSGEGRAADRGPAQSWEHPETLGDQPARPPRRPASLADSLPVPRRPREPGPTRDLSGYVEPEQSRPTA